MPDYSLMADILGAGGAAWSLIPIGVPSFTFRGQVAGENAARTTVTTIGAGGGEGLVFTYSPAPPWDKERYFRGRGKVPIVPMNGTTEYFDTPDADFWTIIEPTAFSIGGVFDQAGVGNFYPLGKDKVSGAPTQREWQLAFISGKPRLLLLDDSTGADASRLADAAVIANTRQHVAFSYNGVGGANAGDGILYYRNGAVAASTVTNNASYVAMENKTSPVGSYITISGAVNGRYSGLMYGGLGGLWLSRVLLTAAQIAAITSIEQAAVRRRFFDLRSRGPVRQ